MKVAYMFIDKYPSYDAVCKIINAMTIDKIPQLNSYIRAGLWGFEGPGNTLDIKIREQQIINTIMSSDGNLFKISNQRERLNMLISEPVYVVQIDCIKKELAINIHNRLINEEAYIGFSQVILNNENHVKAFTGYGPVAI